MALFKKDKPSTERVVPTHIGIIMDVNVRWAKKRMLTRSA